MKPSKFMTPLGRAAKSENERERIFKAYCELGQIERSHSNIQSSYRTLASTWMLAAFAGIGVIISTKGEFAFPIPRELLLVVIALAGAIGLGLLWVLDLLFYQRLLDAAYIEAKDLEDRHPWLPQPRNTMRLLLGGKGLQIVLSYYIALTEVMVFIGGVGWIWLFWPLRTGKFLELRTGPLAILCVIAALASLGLMIWIVIFMRKKTSITSAIEIDLEKAREKRASASSRTSGEV
jgi:hypothetical protein